MEKLINQLLQKKFKHSSFRLGQKEAILSILKGNDTFVMLPTGVGKSLCYQLPAYLLKGTVLIVSPLLSLMQDQVESLKQLGEKKVTAVNSETSFSERDRIFRNIQNYRFIYTSPEMLQNNQFIRRLESIKISMFVVDEAHCISHWGTDFRPDYLILSDIRKRLDNPRTIALTATATKEIQNEIIKFLALNNVTKIIQSVDRPEIKFVVENSFKNKEDLLKKYLKRINGPGIIYFMSKKMSDEWSEKLNKELGIRAASYHSDIEADDKSKIQQQFLKNNLEVVCATSAFGMGFNKKDIRFVIHYHLPASAEMYLQEVGRVSRDGKQGLAVLLYQPGDEQIQSSFIEKSLPERKLIRKVFYKEKLSSNVDESMIKLAKYYLDLTNNLEDAYKLVNKRKNIKEKQLEFMLNYIYEEKCKRKKLLDYFDESKVSNLNECCSSCGINKKALIEEINKEKLKIKENRQVKLINNWKVIFSSLYNMD